MWKFYKGILCESMSNIDIAQKQWPSDGKNDEFSFCTILGLEVSDSYYKIKYGFVIMSRIFKGRKKTAPVLNFIMLKA